MTMSGTAPCRDRQRGVRGMAAAIAALVGIAAAEARGDHAPYAGWQDREVKSLSPEEVADLQAGRGTGLALAAELNGYPGPRHVLDLAAPLALTVHQRDRTAALLKRMQDEAVVLGRRIVTLETALDRDFRAGLADAEGIREKVIELGTLYGQLRFVHLRHHVDMKQVLTPTQLARYRALRGYGPAGADAAGHAEGHEHGPGPKSGHKPGHGAGDHDVPAPR